MDLAIYYNGEKFQKQGFSNEEEFEKEIKSNSKKLFGNKTIYLDIKKKIESISIGKAIPDGILFDLEDPEDIKFYLIEAELSSHSFYEHIFPQITKFFAFYKNPLSQNNLIEKIHSFIINNGEIKDEFIKLLNGQELYKSLKDAIENNQKILLILDGEKPELEEVQNTYTDTWDKFVVVEILNKYNSYQNKIIVLRPDFLQTKSVLEIDDDEDEYEKIVNYTESYHLEGSDKIIIHLYTTIKNHLLKIDQNITSNPQKYYISFRKNRNFAYLDIKKSKIKIAVMLPFEKGQEMIKTHKLRKFTEGVQRFYGRQSFEITIENEENQGEVLDLLTEAYKAQQH